MSENNNPAVHPALKTIYEIQGWGVQFGWVALVAALFWQPAFWIASGVIVAICALYVAMLLAGKRLDTEGKGVDPKSFFSLRGVLEMMRNPRSAFVVWTHILVFDLFVGLFIVVDSQARGISPFLIIPLLFATMMFGPAGLLLYVVLRVGLSGDLGAFSFG